VVASQEVSQHQNSAHLFIWRVKTATQIHLVYQFKMRRTKPPPPGHVYTLRRI